MNEYGEVLENVDLKKYTTFGIGGKCKYLINVYNQNSLINLIKYLNVNKIKYYCLGSGSNVILDDSFFDGVIIKFNKLNKITINDTLVTSECGTKLGMLNNVCLQNGLISLAFLSMIPGEVGSSVIGNVGCYGHEIMDYVQSVKVLTKDCEIKTFAKSEIKYTYRNTDLRDYIVLEVTFKLEKGDQFEALNQMKKWNDERISKQPLDKKSVGSIFKNPGNDSAGRLIESAGLKGYEIGGAKVSEKHANFIVNENNASFNDVISLIEYIQKTVFEKYNISLEPEPIIVRW